MDLVTIAFAVLSIATARAQLTCHARSPLLPPQPHSITESPPHIQVDYITNVWPAAESITGVLRHTRFCLPEATCTYPFINNPDEERLPVNNTGCVSGEVGTVPCDATWRFYGGGSGPFYSYRCLCGTEASGCESYTVSSLLSPTATTTSFQTIPAVSFLSATTKAFTYASTTQFGTFPPHSATPEMVEAFTRTMYETSEVPGLWTWTMEASKTGDTGVVPGGVVRGATSVGGQVSSATSGKVATARATARSGAGGVSKVGSSILICLGWLLPSLL